MLMGLELMAVVFCFWLLDDAMARILNISGIELIYVVFFEHSFQNF